MMEWTICLKSVTGKRINLQLAKGGVRTIDAVIMPTSIAG